VAVEGLNGGPIARWVCRGAQMDSTKHGVILEERGLGGSQRGGEG